jgi:hypothetical protein
VRSESVARTNGMEGMVLVRNFIRKHLWLGSPEELARQDACTV